MTGLVVFHSDSEIFEALKSINLILSDVFNISLRLVEGM